MDLVFRIDLPELEASFEILLEAVVRAIAEYLCHWVFVILGYIIGAIYLVVVHLPFHYVRGKYLIFRDPRNESKIGRTAIG